MCVCERSMKMKKVDHFAEHDWVLSKGKEKRQQNIICLVHFTSEREGKRERERQTDRVREKREGKSEGDSIKDDKMILIQATIIWSI